MNSQSIKLYVFYICAPLFAVFALANGLNANKNLSVASSANSRAKILMAALPVTPKAQKPQVQSSLSLAKLAESHYISKAYQNVAWLFLDLGVLTFCLVKLNKYQQQVTPTAPGNF